MQLVRSFAPAVVIIIFVGFRDNIFLIELYIFNTVQHFNPSLVGIEFARILHLHYCVKRLNNYEITYLLVNCTSLLQCTTSKPTPVAFVIDEILQLLLAHYHTLVGWRGQQISYLITQNKYWQPLCSFHHCQYPCNPRKSLLEHQGHQNIAV